MVKIWSSEWDHSGAENVVIVMKNVTSDADRAWECHKEWKSYSTCIVHRWYHTTLYLYFKCHPECLHIQKRKRKKEALDRYESGLCMVSLFSTPKVHYVLHGCTVQYMAVLCLQCRSMSACVLMLVVHVIKVYNMVHVILTSLCMQPTT